VQLPLPPGGSVPSLAMATLLDLGRRFGGLAWTCERAFETVGAWTLATPEPGWQVRLADHCHRFAFHAERLRWLVPEIAGLTVEDQLAPLAGLQPLDPAAAGTTTADRVAALATHWRAIELEYRSVLSGSNPVSDGPAIRWLRLLAADAADARTSLAHST
jgi:hypothetical protein